MGEPRIIILILNYTNTNTNTILIFIQKIIIISYIIWILCYVEHRVSSTTNTNTKNNYNNNNNKHSTMTSPEFRESCADEAKLT